MSAGDVKHDYHLVNPSPWPLVGSLAACVMAVGGVIAMKGLFGLPKGNLVVFIAGLAGVILTMAAWWRDVTIEANQGDHTPVVSIGLRYGMIMFIASEVMFFVAWFWIFFEMALFHEFRTQSGIEEVRAAWATWPPKGIESVPAWNLPLLNTLILLLSGTTVTWAHHAIIHGDNKTAVKGLALTVLLGLLFTGVQAYEYATAPFNFVNGGIYPSTFFLATGFHGFHVIVGTIFLAVCLVRAMRGHFTPEKHFGFEAAAWYWHFVDVVWLFLFVSIYVLGVGEIYHH